MNFSSTATVEASPVCRANQYLAGTHPAPAPRIVKVVTAARRRSHVCHELGRAHETLLRRYARIRAESRLQRRHEHHFEARAVIPISVSLGIAAVGIVSPLRRGIRCDAPIYQRLAILGRTLQSCQRTEYHARVAHLVPVVLGAEKPRVPVVLRGAEPLLVYRRADYAARTARQTAVKPVVTDGDGHRHLAHVQEMRGVPIRELADGQHLALGAGGIAVVGGNHMGVRQIKKFGAEPRATPTAGGGPSSRAERVRPKASCRPRRLSVRGRRARWPT